MSSVKEQLLAQLGRFDDEAYAALANRGLLRRAQKELEKQAAQVLEEDADALLMGFGEHRIRFDRRGPAHASCTCPTSGVCQHILAAAIGLQRMGEVASDAPSAVQAGGDEASSPPADVPSISELHDSLLAIAQTELVKHAGKAGYRWAWQFVQDLDIEQGLTLGGDRHLVIGFQHPRITLRYMGGGLGSLIADAQIQQIEKYQVAAVLAFRRSNGIDIVPPEATAKAKTASLDLGKDHALPDATPDAMRESRERLRASLRQLLCECVELGLSHLSRGIQERFTTLSVWSQGAEYHRLAMLLRRVADHVEMLLERAAGADEHALFDEISLAFGLVSALDDAASRGKVPTHLVGRARSRYEETGTMELIGLGASPWRSAAGYLGLTMIFWSPKDQAFFSCSDARPEVQRGFDPVARYKAAGPWSGLGAPSQATGKRVVLRGAQLNAAGRLSAAEGTSATLQAAPDLRETLKPCSDWSQLVQQRSMARRSLLAEPQPMLDWVTLQPAKFGAARFDATRQVLVWPLFDAADQRIDAELAYSDYNAPAISRIEQLASEGAPADTWVIAKARGSAAQLVVEPLSLVRADAGAQGNAIDALYFDPAPKRGFASKWLSGFRKSSGPSEPVNDAAASIVVPAALLDMRQWLRRQAERGLALDTARQALQELAQRSERAGAAGFTAFARAPATGAASGSTLLCANYLCMQYERILDDAQDLIA